VAFWSFTVNLKPLRLFFALWPDERVRAELAAVVERLKRSTSARWVQTEKLHMTLAFLGYVQPDRLDALIEAAGNATNSSPFDLVLDRTEFWRGPGIICLGASSAPDALKILAAELAKNLRVTGFELETRPFRAHLTLARKARRLPADFEFADPVHWSVGSFCLIESRQEQAGSSYVVLRSWDLAGVVRTMPAGVPMG
jgi:2'-5' RNA ligase